MTVSDAIEAYLLRLQAENRSANTIRAYRADLQAFSGRIGGETPIESVTREVLRGFLSWLRSDGCAPSSVRRKYAVLKGCLGDAVNVGQLASNAAETVILPKMRSRLPYCPPETELLRALENQISPSISAWPARDRALLEVAYATMARVDELHGMSVSDIDWKQRTILVTGKGDKQRLVLFGEPAADALRDYLRERAVLVSKHKKKTEALFVGCSRHDPGERMTDRRIYSTIKQVCIGLGMSREIHPHSLRRAGATHMLNRGCDLRMINALLGHERLLTTAGYARLAPERLRAVFDRTHPDNRAAS